MENSLSLPRHWLIVTVYVVIFEGRKFRRFCCKFDEREILILKKEAVA